MNKVGSVSRCDIYNFSKLIVAMGLVLTSVVFSLPVKAVPIALTVNSIGIDRHNYSYYSPVDFGANNSIIDFSWSIFALIGSSPANSLAFLTINGGQHSSDFSFAGTYQSNNFRYFSPESFGGTFFDILGDKDFPIEYSFTGDLINGDPDPFVNGKPTDFDFIFPSNRASTSFRGSGDTNSPDSQPFLASAPFGTSGVSVSVRTASVPEPTTIGLMGLGLMGLVGFRKKKLQ